MKRIIDEEIHKLTNHWNPIPSRLEGVTPKEIELRLFRAVADAQLKSCEAQNEKDKRAQEKALADYANGKISFERLAEEMRINFFALHRAFTHFAVTQMPAEDTPRGKDTGAGFCPLCSKPSPDGKEHKECMDYEASR